MEQLTFVGFLLGLWIVITAFYILHCRRGNASIEVHVGDDDVGVENQSVPNSAPAVGEDGEEQLKLEERKARIAKALLTKLIVKNEVVENETEDETEEETEEESDDGCCETIVEISAPKTNDAIDDEADDEENQQQANNNQCVHSKDGKNDDKLSDTNDARDDEECQPEAENDRCGDCSINVANSLHANDGVILLSDMQKNHGEECNVCLVPFRAGDVVAWSKRDRGGCKHAFHEGCISRWLLVRDECPMCRRSFGLELEDGNGE